ncbi:DUF1844 domain-containing protein [bacterium]|nr:DUF1844 domain-containing protein [bacterium]
MDNEEKQEEQDKQLFLQLLTMLQVGAYQQLGLIANPITNKAEKKLEIAKNTIDLIEMVARKTGGNLDDEEEKILNNLLYELRMRYVNELNTSGEEPVEEPEQSNEDKEDQTE